MSEAPKPREVKLSFVEDFMLSGTAAVVSKTLAAPIERIKMVKQNEDEMIKKGTLERRFTGIMDCANWIMKNEGALAFWRSNFTNCIRYFPTQALNFSFKGQVKNIDALAIKKTDGYFAKLTKNIIAGGLAGGGSLLFVYSLDYARTRLANDLKAAKKGGSGREFTGLFDVYRKTWAAEGIRGLYAGFNISFIGIFVYRGLYFGLYDTIMPLVPPESTNLATRFVVGYCVTVLAGLASYPIDTIRRRMMMTAGAEAAHKYKSSMDCASYILRNEGVKSFFKGAGANILRGIAGAGVLSGFDTLVQYYVTAVYGEGAFARISGGGG
jgi:solute carrier family 25 (adenine nucleotide translocator) protein 4/5/6/31